VSEKRIMFVKIKSEPMGGQVFTFNITNYLKKFNTEGYLFGLYTPLPISN